MAGRERDNGMVKKESGLTLNFDDPALSALLFGPQDEHLRTLSGLSGLRLAGRGSSVTVMGEGDGGRNKGFGGGFRHGQG